MTVKTPCTQRGFTLIELLVVIAIIGLLAALTVPALNHFKRADATLSATRQLLDDVDRARQLAVSRHTTVYMVFVPANFWNDPSFPQSSSPEFAKRTNLFDKQLIGYTFATLRNVGDQPGRGTPRYLAPWRALPEGAFIATNKFISRNQFPSLYTRITDPITGRFYDVYGFSYTNTIPFPSEDTPPSGILNKPYAWLPYIAFNYLGQLTKDGVNPSGKDEFIPLAKGSVVFQRDVNKIPQAYIPDPIEKPPGNSTNSFNVIHIDATTGRARLEQQEISG